MKRFLIILLGIFLAVSVPMAAAGNEGTLCPELEGVDFSSDQKMDSLFYCSEHLLQIGVDPAPATSYPVWIQVSVYNLDETIYDKGYFDSRQEYYELGNVTILPDQMIFVGEDEDSDECMFVFAYISGTIQTTIHVFGSQESYCESFSSYQVEETVENTLQVKVSKFTFDISL